jgi:hypothetical protein
MRKALAVLGLLWPAVALAQTPPYTALGVPQATWESGTFAPTPQQWETLFAHKTDYPLTGIIPVVNGGNGTATPNLVAGSNVTITGSWPNQTISAAGGSSGGSPAGAVGSIQTNAGSGAFGSLAVPLPVASGGTGTAAPALVAGSNIAISGVWPNQTIAFAASTFGSLVPTTDNASSLGSATARWQRLYDTHEIVSPSFSGTTLTNVVGFTSPFFIWDNPTGTTVAGYNAQRIWVGNNPTATPAANNNVASTIGVINGNQRQQLWAQNLLIGQCGPAESCAADYVDGPEAGLEIDAFTSATTAWAASNRAFNPTSGVYYKNALEIYNEGPAKLTSGISIWSPASDGSSWFHEGVVLARVADIGLHFVVNPNATDTATPYGVASIEDDSGANVLLGPGAANNLSLSKAVAVRGATTAGIIVQGNASANGVAITSDGTTGKVQPSGAAALNVYPNSLLYTPVNFSALPPCAAAGATGVAMWIKDGPAPTAFKQSVTAGGGTAVEPVYCTYNGTAYGWVY